MISISHNFLFVHIPKTGGNSIQTILLPYADDHKVTSAKQDGINRFAVVNDEFDTKKHSPLWEYKQKIPADIYSHLFKFSIIRNPWERVISYYFSPHRNVTQWNKEDLLSILPTIKPVDYFLSEYEPGQSESKKPGNQKSVFDNVDYVLRNENLQADFSSLCQRLGIPDVILPRVNQSNHDHYSRYYDSELKDIVAKIFEEEIKWGNYSF